MSAGRAILILGAGLGVAYLLARAADQAAAYGVQDLAVQQPGEGQTGLDYLNPWGAIERQVESYQTSNAMQSHNVAAFLSVIEFAEGTGRDGRDPYRTCYAYRHTIQSFADHPAVTGEWGGEPLDNLGPAYAGKVSTAAGRYQIIKPTWLRAKRALGLPDFSPASQDAAAVWLIKQRGALDEVEAGQIEQALALCAPEWASLPASTAGQPTRRLGDLLAAYERAGGYFA